MEGQRDHCEDVLSLHLVVLSQVVEQGLLVPDVEVELEVVVHFSTHSRLQISFHLLQEVFREELQTIREHTQLFRVRNEGFIAL